MVVLKLLVLASVALVWATAAHGQGVRVWLTTEDMKQLLAAGREEPPAPGKPAAGTVIEVDPGQTYQSILGLGASLEPTTCYNLQQLGPERRDEVLRRLLDPEQGIGMNLMRICIGTPDFTGDPWYSYDDMPPGEKDPKLEHFSIEKDRAYILPVLKRALAINPDLLFFASPWSPPGWMKSTGDMIGGWLLPEHYGVYAEYFARFIEAYAAEGIPIYAVTPQNEPGVNTRDYPVGEWYPSCRWSLVEDEDNPWPVDREAMGRNEAEFIGRHLGPALRKHGLATKIWCYDHNINNLWYPRNILNDQVAGPFVDGTGFHGYAGRPEELAGFHREFPDKAIYFTEGSMPGLPGAARIVSLLRNWCRSYNSWVIMIDYDGKPNNGPFKTTRTTIQPRRDGSGVDYNFDYYEYGHFMKFIKRGAVRIGSSEPAAEVTNVAFRNPDGELVLVVVNEGKGRADCTVACGGRHFRAAVPARAIATYCWRP